MFGKIVPAGGLTRGLVRGLARTGLASQPMYTVRTKGCPSYFGHAGEDRSLVFVFTRRSMAEAVAAGLEAYRRQHGAFPSPDARELTLYYEPGRTEPLRWLYLDAVTPREALDLVRGSGVGLCMVNSDHKHAEYAPDNGRVSRQWLEQVLSHRAVDSSD